MSPATLGAGSIAGRWQELQGSESWDGLLDPIDTDLRTSLISYGELAGAAYGGLNSEKRSSHAGQCLYTPEYLLSATGVSHPEYYTVTKFLYATCDLGSVPILAWPVAKAFFVQPVVKVVDPVAPQQQAAAAVEPEPEPWWKKCWEWLEWWKWVKTDWIGYVAVATDEGAAALGRRDIVVAWRGTMEGLEMIKDIVFMGMSAGPLLGPRSASVHRRFRCAKVHGGFLSVYTAEPKPEDSKHKDSDDNEIKTSAREQALDEVRRLMVVHKDEVASITVTGHSLGASLATLNAVDMVANGVNVPPRSSCRPPCPVTAILFACPKVGNCRFKAAFASFPGLRALHVKNDPDVIPRMPPLYADVATVTLHIDTRKSPHLRVCNVKPLNPLADLFTYHNLECYLHGVAGYRGAADGVGFELVVDRDVALVNKSADALVDTYEVPANWWVVSNKFMVKQPDGHWELDDHEKKKQSSDDGQNDNAGA